MTHGIPSPTSHARCPDPDREYHCDRYSACLDCAVDSGWPGFSCARCPHRAYAASLKPGADVWRRRNTEDDRADPPCPRYMTRPRGVPTTGPVGSVRLDAARMRSARGARGLTYQALARLCGVHASVLQRIETSTSDRTNLRTVVRIEAVLGRLR
jgi:ribosome-binding protein aMBF1 (putative translation factor)